MDSHSNQVPGLDSPQSPSEPEDLNNAGGAIDQVLVQNAVPIVGDPQPASMPLAGDPKVTAEEDMESLDQDWINKAKDIVEQTKSDPFTEAKELEKIRAGYLKVRYNKELNVSEDHS